MIDMDIQMKIIQVKELKSSDENRRICQQYGAVRAKMELQMSIFSEFKKFNEVKQNSIHWFKKSNKI